MDRAKDRNRDRVTRPSVQGQRDTNKREKNRDKDRNRDRGWGIG